MEKSFFRSSGTIKAWRKEIFNEGRNGKKDFFLIYCTYCPDICEVKVFLKFVLNKIFITLNITSNKIVLKIGTNFEIFFLIWTVVYFEETKIYPTKFCLGVALSQYGKIVCLCMTDSGFIYLKKN